MSLLTGENSNDSIDGDLNDGTFHKGVLQQPQRLLDLASKVVAKNCSCTVLEVQKPPLDEALLQKVGNEICDFLPFFYLRYNV